MKRDLVSISLTSDRRLDILSKAEVAKLTDTFQTGPYNLYRKCALEIINSDIVMNTAAALFSQNESFDICLLQQDRRLRLEIYWMRA